jgi:hypothetical protein
VPAPGFTTSFWWGLCQHLGSPPVFGGVCVPAPGFTTSFWWGLCASTWVHHQFLVGSVPAPWFTTSFWWGLCASTLVHHQFLAGSVLLIILVFCVVLCFVCLRVVFQMLPLCLWGYCYGVKCHFWQYFSYIVAVSFIDGENLSILRKPLTSCKPLANFIT